MLNVNSLIKPITGSLAKVSHTLLTNKYTAPVANYIVNNGSTILTIGGIVLNGVAIYQMFKKAPEIQKTIDEGKVEVETIINNAEADPNATEEYVKKEVIKSKKNTAIRCLRVLAPVIAIFLTGNLCAVGSCAVLQHENNKVTKLLENEIAAFATYRSAVIDKYGNEEDQKLRYKNNVKLIDEIDPKTGEVTKKEIFEFEPDLSDRNLIRVSIRTNSWSCDKEIMKKQIRLKLASLNDTLRWKGFLFKGEIQELFDDDYTDDSFTTGYIYAPDRRDHFGTSVVDCVIHEPTDSFGDYWLTFNFDTKPINAYIPRLKAYQRGDI